MRKPKTAADVSCANLQQFMWGDPAYAYERIEGTTCCGCEWVIPIHVAGQCVDSCGKGRRIGMRCKYYEETSRDCGKAAST